ncbi:MAG: helix-turn-helix domain-containing protein [Mesorhizobium sp.]|uniref:helix-turn-helix domain-containing protein n=1 Tax=unclassified Mesorhizobium TaxID=325217 RepID=UPI000F7560F0|nr:MULTISPECIES: XRE family transcriptional regulator [unclassified Mesorhizobium]AZO74732.1 XRE family transcriptional regulator [Mesorhizobium sp. M1D.F.Ca.ET.043.01.1.1]RWA96401.1 MAG: helix-turn-helix domain-containing protein [Mesorhizobium sp.]RWE14950.1 MAG: helix-turn-helix domain-containing protein [Mesorhizobium sp.]TJW86699.1 MAG: helix-turn-helix domain-containing protein [Mesorhizobium sp.]
MADISNEITSTIGRRIRSERDLRGWSLAELAERSAVSKAMLSAMERGMTSPTAALLVRIASAFGMTLSTLIARAEMQGGGVCRKDEQPVWQDPATGYVRRHLSPATQMPLELIRVSLPAGAKVDFPAASYAFIKQQIWLIGGRLDFTEGDVVHRLEPGDCLALGAPSDCTFHAPGPEAAEYLVALVRG